MTRLLISARIAPSAELGLPVAEADGTTYESFAEDCWLLRGRGATVQMGHDEADIGEVLVVAGCRDGWHHADFIVEDPSPEVRERLKVGVGVSLGARALKVDHDHHLRERRVKLAQLEHVAVCRHGEVPTFDKARITAVRELAPKPAASIDWRERLPREYADFADCFDGDEPPSGVLLRGNAKVGIRWDGDGRRWVAASAA